MTLFNRQGNFLVGGELPLATKKGRQIPNDRRPQRHPDALRAASEMVLQSHPSARLRALSAVYNCMGMVFATRRTWIDPEEMRLILDDDEYRQINVNDEELLPDDIVVYRNQEGSITHVGLVAQIRIDVREANHEITILSQWGSHGEYFHRVNDVHPLLGVPTEYYTDRG